MLKLTLLFAFVRLPLSIVAELNYLAVSYDSQSPDIQPYQFVPLVPPNGFPYHAEGNPPPPHLAPFFIDQPPNQPPLGYPVHPEGNPPPPHVFIPLNQVENDDYDLALPQGFPLYPEGNPPPPDLPPFFIDQPPKEPPPGYPVHPKGNPPPPRVFIPLKQDEKNDDYDYLDLPNNANLAPAPLRSSPKRQRRSNINLNLMQIVSEASKDGSEYKVISQYPDSNEPPPANVPNSFPLHPEQQPPLPDLLPVFIPHPPEKPPPGYPTYPEGYPPPSHVVLPLNPNEDEGVISQYPGYDELPAMPPIGFPYHPEGNPPLPDLPPFFIDQPPKEPPPRYPVHPKGNPPPPHVFVPLNQDENDGSDLAPPQPPQGFPLYPEGNPPPPDLPPFFIDQPPIEPPPGYPVHPKGNPPPPHVLVQAITHENKRRRRRQKRPRGSVNLMQIASQR